MRTRLSSALLIISAGVCAQPVFVHPDAVPSLGAYPVETRSYGVVPGLVTSGSEVVWDFSAQDFSIIGTTTDSVLLPSATPYAADFPTATHAVRLVNQFGYYRASSTGVLDLGTRLSPGSPSQINTDPAAILQFPAAVEDSWTDAVITGTTTSQLQVTILAAGTIVLEDATIPDAVLVERRQTSPSFTAISTTWFQRGNGLVPLGNILANGGVIVRVPVNLITTIAERDVPTLTLAPNPAVGNTVLQRTDGVPLGQVRLLDAAGREVRSLRVNSAYMEFQLTDLPNGSYVVQVISADGVRTQRLINGSGGL
ncbi:MAG: T9SS type A sorting domain-containing protein [Flavobacteriales bacterium]|nr:T9SS type A sorting domain-containing protein [Flavobacteriales bacterium]